MEAIILAGGLGTRLRDAVPDLPKCMAPIAGKPFISYVINYYKSQGVRHFILSLGYRHELVTEYCSKNYHPAEISYVIEKEPLGTGGALQLAMQKVQDENVLVVNGDTFFSINCAGFENFHKQHDSTCSLALKRMTDFDRYGAVMLDAKQRVTAFTEKKAYSEGLINGGVYQVKAQRFMDKKFPDKFSFEKDFLEAYVQEGAFYGFIQDGYFIDIGIPLDYERAQQELPELFQTL